MIIAYQIICWIFLVKYIYYAAQRLICEARTISPTPPAIEISTPGKSSWDPPPPPLLPLDGFCLGERSHDHSSHLGVYLLLYRVLVPVHRWLAHEVRFSPLTPHFLCTSLRYCTVGIPFSSLTVGAERSKPFAKYLSISVVWACRGTRRLVTSALHLHFAFGKASVAVTLVSRLKCLD